MVDGKMVNGKDLAANAIRDVARDEVRHRPRHSIHHSPFTIHS
jgi:hypothetical protein